MRLISQALTGYFRTMVRPRQHRPLSMLKYDPVGTWRQAPELESKLIRAAQCDDMSSSSRRSVEAASNAGHSTPSRRWLATIWQGGTSRYHECTYRRVQTVHLGSVFCDTTPYRRETPLQQERRRELQEYAAPSTAPPDSAWTPASCRSLSFFLILCWPSHLASQPYRRHCPPSN